MQAQVWSHGTSRHLQVVPWCSGWSQPCHFPPLPPHPSRSIRSCQPDRQLYFEATPPPLSPSSGPLITLLLSHVTAPFRGPRFTKQTLACVFLLPRVQPPATQPRLWDTEPSAGLRVRDPALQPWHCPRLPCGSTSLHAPLPPSATLLSAVPGPSLLGSRPGLQQASLPFHASLCLNVHPQPVGHPRRQSWVCPAPHGSEGPS